MKLSTIEIRKLERRLPLWESSYKFCNPSEKRELRPKIENARNALGLPPFEFLEDKAPIVVKSVAKPKKEPKQQKEKERIKYTPEDVIKLHNELKLSDMEIAKKFNIVSSSIAKFKKRYINTVVCIKSDSKITPTEYCEMKNALLSDVEIRKHYNIHQDTLCGFKNKFIQKNYRMIEDVVVDSKYKQILIEIVERCNEGELFVDIVKEKGLSLPYLSRIKQKYIEEYYTVKETSKLTPEKYVELSNGGMHDYEISKLFNVEKNAMTRFKKNYISIRYELKK